MHVRDFMAIMRRLIITDPLFPLTGIKPEHEDNMLIYDPNNEGRPQLHLNYQYANITISIWSEHGCRRVGSLFNYPGAIIRECTCRVEASFSTGGHNGLLYKLQRAQLIHQVLQLAVRLDGVLGMMHGLQRVIVEGEPRSQVFQLWDAVEENPEPERPKPEDYYARTLQNSYNSDLDRALKWMLDDNTVEALKDTIDEMDYMGIKKNNNKRELARQILEMSQDHGDIERLSTYEVWRKNRYTEVEIEQ